jgi:tRNA1Val (adenine37-N6)-methyltransferase
MNETTADSFFGGLLRVVQHRDGYRFSIDAVLLAHHAGARSGETVVDLGTGCGIIPLILSFRHPGLRIFGIEVQEGLSELASRNVAGNRMEERITILRKDLRGLESDLPPGCADLVTSNPPFRKPNTGRVNPDAERAVARHEIRVSLPELISAARRLLKISGRFVAVYPAERTAELLSELRESRIEPKFLRTVHSHLNTEAKLVLVEGIKHARPGLKIAPPLAIYREDGAYTGEVEAMFRA